MSPTELPPVEVKAGAVSVHDRLAIYSGRSRHSKYVRIRRVYHDREADTVTITPAEGPAMVLRSDQRVKVASSRGSR